MWWRACECITSLLDCMLNRPRLLTRQRDDDGDPTQPDDPQFVARTVVDQSVYTLYSPKDEPELDVVFFHGLQLGDYEEAYIRTWESVDPKSTGKANICWPAKWLGADFLTARISSVSYDARPFGGGGEELREIVRTLLQNLVVHAEVGHNRPIILVGHSLGGLVIKKMCVEADALRKKCNTVAPYAEQFLKNMLGAFFYATPHGGATLAETVMKLDFFQEAAPVLKLLGRENLRLTELSEDFDTLRTEWNWKIWGANEVRPVRLGPFKRVVVPPSSARHDTTTFYFTVNFADHFTICKPQNQKNDPRYIWLKRFVQDMLDQESAAKIDRPYRAVRGLSNPKKVLEALHYIELESIRQRGLAAANFANFAKSLLDAGVMPQLSKQLASHSNEIKEKAVLTLKCLADTPGLEELKVAAGRAGALEPLLDMLEYEAGQTALLAILCLRVLTDNLENWKRLKTRGGSRAKKVLESLIDRTTTSNESLDNYVVIAARTMLDAIEADNFTPTYWTRTRIEYDNPLSTIVPKKYSFH